MLSWAQFDFVKLLDGKQLPRSLADPGSAPRGLLLSALQETGFIEYMDPGTWHLAVYNDGRSLEPVLLHSTPIGEEATLHLAPYHWVFPLKFITLIRDLITGKDEKYSMNVFCRFFHWKYLQNTFETIH